MANHTKTKDCFLWFMSLIYMFAFSSLYIQIPGLYGDNGILPARLVMNKDEPTSWQELMDGQPTLLKLMPRLGLDTQRGMDLLALAGMVISFFCVVSRTARDFVSFTLLWMLYLSLYQVGQTFLWFQWDILLLEAGFLAIIIAPFNLQILGRRRPTGSAHDRVTLWLLRWLLFRLMFASGVVKLTSECPTWWGLSALKVHFESQCIPTPAAWYWHQLPEWFLKLSVVATYVIEIAVPFLFFSPLHSLKVIAFWVQVLLQMMIIMTGNYNFFNLLTITICIGLLDDDFFMFARPTTYNKSNKKVSSKTWANRLRALVKLSIPLAVLGYMLYMTVKLFSLTVDAKNYSIKSEIAFTKKQFYAWLEQVMPFTFYFGLASLSLEIMMALVRSVVYEKGMFRKCYSTAGTVLFSLIAVFMFTVSLVPLSHLDSKAYSNLPKYVKTWHDKIEPFGITSSYGLFRTMTGVGGRPEIILQGHATDGKASSGWKTYDFMYKPGNVSEAPAVVAPHQPRLDWQMWFAALGNYQSNPWFLNLAYRLLQGEPDVMELLSQDRQPFPALGSPPKFVRATLYTYHYTTGKDCEGKSKCAWWKRQKKADYLPALSLNDKSFIDYIKSAHLDKKAPEFRSTNYLAKFVVWAREMIGQPEGFQFTFSMFGSSILAMFLNRALF